MALSPPMQRAVLGALMCLMVAARFAAAIPAAEVERGKDAKRSAELAAKGAEQFAAGELQQALRSYQRAFFWARLPGEQDLIGAEQVTPEWLEEIVPLAVSADRIDEAIRYTLLLPAEVTNDSQTLRLLARHARESQHWREAAQLQQRWLAARRASKTSLQSLLPQIEIGRMRYLAKDMQGASLAFEPIQRILIQQELAPSTSTRLKSALGGSLAASWELFGQAHLAAGRKELAQQAFAALVELPDANSRATFRLAQLAIENNRPLEAYDLVRRCLDSHPTGLDENSLGSTPLALLPVIYRQLNQSAEVALDELRQYAADHPQNLTARLVLGLALRDADRKQEAETVLAKVIQQAFAVSNIDPLTLGLTEQDAPEPDTRVAQLAGAWLLKRYASTGNQDAFVSLVHQLQDVFDNLLSFENDLQTTFDDHPQFAQNLLRSVAGQDSTSTIAPAAVATLAMAAKQYSTARHAYQSTIEQEPNPSRRQLLTLLWWQKLFVQEQYESATAALLWSIEHSVWLEEATPYFHLAGTYALNDQPAKAVDVARKAAELAPDDAAMAERFAWTLSHADRTDEAIDRYSKLIKDFDDQRDSATREVLRGARATLSYLSDEQGDTEAAIEWDLQALDEFPENPGILNDLGYLWAKQGVHLHRSIRMAERAVELRPDSAAYWDTLGWAQFQAGKLKAALEAIEKALALLKDADEDADGEIFDHLGDIQSALGQSQAAEASWRQAVEAFNQAEKPKSAEEVRGKLPSATNR